MSDITINETPYILQKYSIEKNDGEMVTIGYQAMREEEMLDGTTQYQFLAGAKPDGYEVLREIVDEVNMLSKMAYESGTATNFITDTTLISDGHHIEQLKKQGLYLERQAFTNNAQEEKIIIETMGSKTITHNIFTQNDQKKTERVLVMDGQRFVQSQQDGKWNTDKVEKAGTIKPGIYNIHLSAQADKAKTYDGVILYADQNNVYQQVGKSFIKHDRSDFNKVSDIGQVRGISYDKIGKAIVVDAANVKLSQGLSH